MNIHKLTLAWLLFGSVLHWTGVIDVSWWAITMPFLICFVLHALGVVLQEWANS